jgi:signal peptidase I
MPIIWDFALILVLLAALTGVIWAFDLLLLKPQRAAGAREPIVIEYARSFFPIILIVLAVRSFVFEPFRIPSDSMMPTLLDGDFIFVNKWAYGLKLPVLNTKILSIGEPQRGDVIVFRKPQDLSTNYIKRLIGLPGDQILVRGAAVWVNGKAVEVHDDGVYTDDPCYSAFRQGVEMVGAHEHRIMYCPGAVYQPRCTASRTADVCRADPGQPAQPSDPNGRSPWPMQFTVPPGHYFFMGDNRDNSADSRFTELGYVPVGNVVGKAVRIWLNISLPPGEALRRIGHAIR